jgi:hypothetical protein
MSPRLLNHPYEYGVDVSLERMCSRLRRYSVSLAPPQRNFNIQGEPAIVKESAAQSAGLLRQRLRVLQASANTEGQTSQRNVQG